MSKYTRFFLTILVVFAVAGVVQATEIKNPGDTNPSYTEDTLQEILNNITVGDSSVDAAGIANAALVYDAYWGITASGGSVTTFVIEITGGSNSNTFGIYDAFNSDNRLELFDASASTGNQVTLSIDSNGLVYKNHVATSVDLGSTTFGYYITTGNGSYFSDTALNGDKFDHLVAFQGTGDTVQIFHGLTGFRVIY
jgi:hypothetical protein